MRSLSARVGTLLPLLMLVALPAVASGQNPTTDSVRLEAYATAYTAIGKLRDTFQAEAAQASNKHPEAVEALQEKLREDVASVLEENGFSQEEYAHITFLVSTDLAVRRTLNGILGIEEEEDQEADAVAGSPDNPHVGHVLSSFAGTPGEQGLLAVALGEAAVAIEHAELAAAAGDLSAMKVHAGHVIHAIQPEAGSRGPGAGYGLATAASGIATHTELAAQDSSASEHIRMHAVHVVTAANTTAARAGRVLALAREIEAATSVAEAAPLAERMSALAAELMSGQDADGDGQIGWQEGEGGLRQVERHLELLVEGGRS